MARLSSKKSTNMIRTPFKVIRKKVLSACTFCIAGSLLLGGCADVSVPGARNLKIPSPTMADERPEAVNEKPDSVLYLPLGSDVLVPETRKSSFEVFLGLMYWVTVSKSKGLSQN